MTRNVILAILLLVSVSGLAQIQTNIIGDSVKIKSNTGTGELILENSTKNVNGFLYNKGNGRTEFRKALIKVNDSIYLVGTDTLNLNTYASGKGWKTTGNAGTNPVSNFVGTLDSNGFVVRTNNMQRLSVWADGTVNIAGSDTTTKPVFRFYPNGDFSSSSTNRIETSQVYNENGLRFHKKLGILEIGTSNYLDTSLGISQGRFGTSAILVNSDSNNTIKGRLISAIIAGDGIVIDSASQVNWSLISGEQHWVHSTLSKTNVFGYGHWLQGRGYTGCLITGISHRMDSLHNTSLIAGFHNFGIDTTNSSFVTGFENRYSGTGQFLAGGNLISQGYGSATLGLANVNFSSLSPGAKAKQPANLKSYPLLAIGNSSAYATLRSNAFTMMYSGRTQINTTGYDSPLTEADVTPKAALEVVSTNSGVLLPKLTTAQRDAIVSGDRHNGLLLYNTDSSRFQFYNGSTWKNVGDNGSSTGNIYTIQTLTDGTTVTWNAANGNNGYLELTGTGRTLSITNPVAGQTYRVKIKQDNTGNRTITTWPTDVLWPSGNPPVLSTVPGSIDMVTFYYDGTNYYGNYNLAYQAMANVSILSTNAQNAFEESVQTITNVPAGALLVLTTAAESSQATASVSSVPALTWTKRVDASASNSGDAEIYTAVFSAGGTITVTSNWGDNFLSSVVYTIINQETNPTWYSSTGVQQAAPSVSHTTHRANSLLICVTSDFSGKDGANRSYRNSSVETKYQYDANHGTAYHYYKQATNIASYIVGMLAPSDQEGGTAVLEILGR